jgi:membrane-associated protease RseP (regulator of RpoE activity)
MKSHLHFFTATSYCCLALAGTLAASPLRAAADDSVAAGSAVVTVTADSEGATASASGGGQEQKVIIIKSIEPGSGVAQTGRKDQGWLGVGIEEASEALASQLGLAPGVGLLITYVAADSPAAKAGLKKNDVLVELDGQSLVHPAQLRKLVQVRKEGDSVDLVFYRTGKKQTVSAKLGQAPAGLGMLDDERSLSGDLGALSQQLHDLPIGDAIHKQIRVYRDSLDGLKLDQKKIQVEVQRSLEQARKAYDEAVRYSTNIAASATAKALKELQRAGVLSDIPASVTVRSIEQSAKSIVKTDDTGTIVVVSNPKPHLTAHDKDGKLLFDGEIDTQEQRSKVPPELWDKVKPLLEKSAPHAEDEPEAPPAPAKQPSASNQLTPSAMTTLGTRII